MVRASYTSASKAAALDRAELLSTEPTQGDEVMGMTRQMDETAEGRRLRDADVDGVPWRLFGPATSL